MSALDRQVGGNHYKGFPIQPVEFIEKNKLGFLQGCIIKRLCRYDNPDTGKGLQDIDKMEHELELLKEFFLSGQIPDNPDISRQHATKPVDCVSDKYTGEVEGTWVEPIYTESPCEKANNQAKWQKP